MLNTYLLKTSKDDGGLVIVLYPDWDNVMVCLPLMYHFGKF